MKDHWLKISKISVRKATLIQMITTKYWDFDRNFFKETTTIEVKDKNFYSTSNANRGTKMYKNEDPRHKT